MTKASFYDQLAKLLAYLETTCTFAIIPFCLMESKIPSSL